MGTISNPGSCDDIADLARKYLNAPERVDALIAAAQSDSRWDEMGKWHRVRFRLLRMQQEQASGEAARAPLPRPRPSGL
jgi:hypothetical protein